MANFPSCPRTAFPAWLMVVDNETQKMEKSEIIFLAYWKHGKHTHLTIFGQWRITISRWLGNDISDHCATQFVFERYKKVNTGNLIYPKPLHHQFRSITITTNYHTTTCHHCIVCLQRGRLVWEEDKGLEGFWTISQDDFRVRISMEILCWFLWCSFLMAYFEFGWLNVCWLVYDYDVLVENIHNYNPCFKWYDYKPPKIMVTLIEILLPK